MMVAGEPGRFTLLVLIITLTLMLEQCLSMLMEIMTLIMLEEPHLKFLAYKQDSILNGNNYFSCII